jgi:hypothetical protein
MGSLYSLEKDVFANMYIIGIVESRRDIPYGPRNLQKFAHFYVLSAHYIALLNSLDVFSRVNVNNVAVD